jgi:hypothetical protein
VKNIDLDFIGWVMATMTLLYAVFLQKTLLMERLNLGSSFAWSLDDS